MKIQSLRKNFDGRHIALLIALICLTGGIALGITTDIRYLPIGMVLALVFGVGAPFIGPRPPKLEPNMYHCTQEMLDDGEKT